MLEYLASATLTSKNAQIHKVSLKRIHSNIKFEKKRRSEFFLIWEISKIFEPMLYMQFLSSRNVEIPSFDGSTIYEKCPFRVPGGLRADRRE